MDKDQSAGQDVTEEATDGGELEELSISGIFRALADPHLPEEPSIDSMRAEVFQLEDEGEPLALDDTEEMEELPMQFAEPLDDDDGERESWDSLDDDSVDEAPYVSVSAKLDEPRPSLIARIFRRR